MREQFSVTPTKYNEVEFRSRLAARWAYFFDKVNIRYEYEGKTLKLSNGELYLPDFYLPDFHCYFEVQPKGARETVEGNEAIWKISDGSHTNSWAGIICFGDPVDHDMEIYCKDICDSSGGSYSSRVVFGHYIGTKKPMLFSWDDTRDREFLTCFGKYSESIPMQTDCNYAYTALGNPFVTEDVIEAEKRARRTGFDDGELMP